MSSTITLYHPAAHCPDCGFMSINTEQVADNDDQTIHQDYEVRCDKCGQDLEVTEIKGVEYGEY